MPLYRDLFMRDTFSDSGIVPVTDSSVCASPDIMPYGGSQLDTATASYGPPLINLPLDNNNVNNIYVRVKNNGAMPGSGQVYLHYTDATLLTNVSSWGQNLMQNFNGNDYASIDNLAPGATAFGDEPFAWNPQAQPNQHFCLIARVVTDANPNPLPGNFSSWQDFVTWVRNNANVAWHNVQIVNTLPAQGYENSLVFQNVGTEASFFTFTATYSGLPVGSVLRLWALPGTGFPGFDTGPTPITEGSGTLPATGEFPAGYETLVFVTCVFPGGPTTPPPAASIVLESWAPQAQINLAENAPLRPYALAPEMLGVQSADVALAEGEGSLVQITSYNVYFSSAPTGPALTARALVEARQG
ncbi:MAG TPA: hypothetical protein VF605_16735 [Allosphingosinicella sp.]|jgi:hypothetical protein